MNHYNKLCDAADWFRPGIQEIIEDELHEVPRFHRKQWEFAMIVHALCNHGKLHSGMLGLSMGGGKELVAYAVARHVKQLVITDLYDLNTSWDCAKTEHPDEFIRRHKPFPVDDSKLKALRMDMRELTFPDATFDFCYSTCAVEHIGGREDFLRHFNEVARVLKPDGVYVFTTEIVYGSEPIRDDHNYIFSIPFLSDIISESGLVLDGGFDARVAENKIHYPFPSAIGQLSFTTETNLPEALLQERVHIQLMRGRHPFTCGIFVLKRKHDAEVPRPIHVTGLEATRRFMERGVQEYRSIIQDACVTIHPFSQLPGERSRFCADHVEFFTKPGHSHDPETVFHSDYMWWGEGRRVFDIQLRVDNRTRSGNPEIELRVHRYKTLESTEIECVASITCPVQQIGWMVKTIHVDTDDACCYAILAKIRGGTCSFDRIMIRSCPLSRAEIPLHISSSIEQLVGV